VKKLGFIRGFPIFPILPILFETVMPVQQGVVVQFDFHRSRSVLPDALDFGHAQTQAPNRKAS
jgi:hypothetical protein